MAKRTVTPSGPKRDERLDVSTSRDGSVVIHAVGTFAQAEAVELRQLLVHTVRHVRPLRLILDLADVVSLDAINVGTLAAACALGDDHQVAVFIDHPSPQVAERLRLAGIPAQRLRHIDSPG